MINLKIYKTRAYRKIYIFVLLIYFVLMIIVLVRLDPKIFLRGAMLLGLIILTLSIVLVKAQTKVGEIWFNNTSLNVSLKNESEFEYFFDTIAYLDFRFHDYKGDLNRGSIYNKVSNSNVLIVQLKNGSTQSFYFGLESKKKLRNVVNELRRLKVERGINIRLYEYWYFSVRPVNNNRLPLT